MSLLEGQNSGTMPVPVSKVETLYSYIKVSTGSLCVQAFHKCLDNSVLCIPITPFYTSFKMASDKAFQHSTAFHVCEWYLQSCGRKDTMFFLWDNQPPHYKWYSSERSCISSVFFSNFLFYKFLTFLLLLSLTPEFTTFSRDSLVLSYTLDSYLVAVFQSAVDWAVLIQLWLVWTCSRENIEFLLL